VLARTGDDKEAVHENQEHVKQDPTITSVERTSASRHELTFSAGPKVT
jgi:hypothetical protein